MLITRSGLRLRHLTQNDMPVHDDHPARWIFLDVADVIVAEVLDGHARSLSDTTTHFGQLRVEITHCLHIGHMLKVYKHNCIPEYMAPQMTWARAADNFSFGGGTYAALDSRIRASLAAWGAQDYFKGERDTTFNFFIEMPTQSAHTRLSVERVRQEVVKDPGAVNTQSDLDRAA